MARIMIVDNEADTVEAVSFLLEASGFEPAKALSGKECLKKHGAKPVDLILLDIMMPDMSGWDVYATLRKTDTKTKVIFLSALEISKERFAVLKKHGVSDYVTKPFDNDDLIKRIKTALKKK